MAFVVARLSSSRLPAKQLRTIGERSILEWIFHRLQACRELDDVVLTTVAEPANEPLRTFAAEAGVPCFWYKGEIDHVTTRLRRAAESYGAELCVLVSGDCPLVHPEAVDRFIRALRSHPEADYCTYTARSTGEVPHVEGIQAARRRAWQKADDLSVSPELKEHQFPILGRRQDLFRKLEVALPEDLYGLPHRMSVDTPADLEFMNAVHDRLARRGKSFAMPDAVALLKEEPALRELNRHVHQKGLVEASRNVLFALDAGPPYGYGHLTRCVELASQIVERKGWPVAFLIDDAKACEMASRQGMKVIWGAWGRTARPRHGGTGAAVPDQARGAPDLLCLDIWPGRTPPVGWRSELPETTRIAVLDNAAAWSRDADLLVMPCVTFAQSQDGLPPVIGGEDHLILRREIRRAAWHSRAKDIDILAYLHPPEQREAFAGFARTADLEVCLLEDFRPDFAELLARSRLFVSGFGYSFYEALAVRALPVAWPLSPRHGDEAQVFYKKLGMAPHILSDSQDFEKLPRLCTDPPVLPLVADGTSRIVSGLAGLLGDP